MPGAFDQSSLEQELERMRERFRAIEAQLSVLSEKTGVPYINPSATAPPDVVELARAGKRLEALKRYREITNSTVEEAQAVVDKL